MELIRGERRSYKMLAASIGGASLALALPSGCSSLPTPDSAKQSSHHRVTKLVPDMSGFLQNSRTCLNGGARPCAVQLRTKPKLLAAVINADPTAKHVSWPLESYHGQSGDPVTVDCYQADGQKVGDYSGDPPSTDWYKVTVPAGRVANPAVRARLKGHDSIAGYASVEWFGESQPQTGIPTC